MPEAGRIRVSVVHAERGRVFNVTMVLADGATVADAIEASGIRRLRPDIGIAADRVGVFARRVALDARLADGDRVEIYRPLRTDPKESRRLRAQRTARG